MSDGQTPPEWLASHYDQQRRRSAKMVEDAIIDLLTSGTKITEESVVARSKVIDPECRGVSRSTLHRNPACWKRFALARGGKVKTRKATAIRAFFAAPDQADESADALKARARRLMRLRKDELAAQVLALEMRVAELEAAGYAKGEAEFEKAMQALRET